MTTTTANLNLRPTAGTKDAPTVVIPKGAPVTVTGPAWYPVTYNSIPGWVSGKYLDLAGTAEPDPVPSDYVSDALALARSMLGLYYRWGGNFTQEPFSAKRGDCSGFVGFVSETMGYQPGSQPLYHSTADAMYDNYRTGKWPAETVALGDEQPMDLVFYGSGTNAGHVVFVERKGHVIGASGGGVSTTSDAAAKARGAMVRIDTIDYRNDRIGIFRPAY